MTEPFDEEYFLRGRQSGKSLYENYRWLPDLTIPMVCAMIRHLSIDDHDLILDFGCARGYVVRAFRELGYAACGYDVSRWALEHADEVAKEFLIVNESTLFAGQFDWVIAKDVLEHITVVSDTINMLMEVARKGVFAVVPLGYGEDGYEVPEYDLDVTHVHRWTLERWVEMFLRPGWSVEASYRVKGIKDNYARYHRGNGFLTARRI